MENRQLLIILKCVFNQFFIKTLNIKKYMRLNISNHGVSKIMSKGLRMVYISSDFF